MTTAASTSIPATAGPPQPASDVRLAVGLLGVLLAAMVAGLNNRVPGLALADLQGALGFAQDDASWLNTVYSAGELAAMPFAAWFAITFSVRRFHLAMLAAALTLSAIMPLVLDLRLLLVLRAIQGLCSGALIPILLMIALRFMPPAIRLHGFGLFALTATFAPNVALWLAAWCVDRLEDWRWVYWHVIPLGLLAAALVIRGIPKMPPAPERLKQGNWLGLALGIPGLSLLVVGLDQGVRLDWFNSPLITAALGTGIVFTALFLVSEWRHPSPFIKPQLLGRRNLGIGFGLMVCFLLTTASAVALPINVLGRLQGFRMEQSATIGLLVGLPQLALGPVVGLLLYQRWVDARLVLATGLACVAAACWLGSGLTSEWMVEQFVWVEILQAVGQPMVIISVLLLTTSVVQPMEAPYVAGIANVLFRAFGVIFGGTLTNQLMTARGQFHAEMLLDYAGLALPQLSLTGPALDALPQLVAQQASVLAATDVYRMLGMLALLLIPMTRLLQRVPAPAVNRTPQAAPSGEPVGAGS